MVRHVLDDDHAKYTDVRLVRDKKTGKFMGFVDFLTVNDAKEFMYATRGQLEIRKNMVYLNYSNPKERRDYERIREALDDARVPYLDVRVIKDKASGLSKGFGFVDFASVHEARRWMENQKGVFRVSRNDIRLMYSTPRSQLDSLPHFGGDGQLGLLGPAFIGRPSLSDVSTGDWICSRCSSHNFRRREQCYKCQLPRSQVQSLVKSVDGVNLIGTTPCNTLILRCLDAFTTEDDICDVFHNTADVKVRQCHIMRDEVTHASLCYAFAELPTVADAYKVMDIVSKEFKLFEIGGKAITVSYAKNTFNTIMATLKTEGSYNAQLNSSRNLALDIAHAALAARNSNGNVPADAVAINAVAASNLLNSSSNSGIAVAQAAIQQKQTEQHVLSALTKSLRNPTELSSNYSSTTSAASGQPPPPPSFPFNAALANTTTYPYPDTSKYIFDEATRFYYDPITGLLYEPNSKYFYDRATQKYYYWDQTKSTYIPVPQSVENDSSNKNTTDQPQSTEASKTIQGKNAQQIAKEMEKWAKRMNAQKKTGSGVVQKTEAQNAEASRSADTGYAILEASVTSNDSRMQVSSTTSNSLVAEYGGVGDSDEEQDKPFNQTMNFASNTGELEAKVSEEESRLLDWSKLACMLCSRGFKDAETLQKHRAFSSLHYENLNKLRAKYGLPPIPTPSPNTNPEANANEKKGGLSISSLMQIGAQKANEHAKTVAARQSGNVQYRDRAKERRDKYGIPSPPRVQSKHSPIEQPILESFATPPPVLPTPIAPLPTTTNVGSRLMEKMGWQAGQGLGRSNQGRTELIEAELREAGVGLGVKTNKRSSQSDNYKDNVKRAMFARFHEND